MQKIWLNFKSSQQILTNFQPVRFLLHRQVDSWLCVRVEGCCSSNISQPEHIVGCPAPDLRQPATKASHTIDSNNTHTVLSSWWWAQKCPKHVEHIISAINHSVASSWFFFSTHMQRCMDRHTSNQSKSCDIQALDDADRSITEITKKHFMHFTILWTSCTCYQFQVLGHWLLAVVGFL